MTSNQNEIVFRTLQNPPVKLLLACLLESCPESAEFVYFSLDYIPAQVRPQ